MMLKPAGCLMTTRWLAAALSVACLPAAEVRVTGRVTDENQVAIAGARVSLGRQSAVTDPTGAFLLVLDQPGEYLLQAEREGFFLLRNRPVQLRDGENILTVALNHHREEFDSVEVSAAPTAINLEDPSAGQQLSGVQLMAIPYPSTHDLRNALPLMPGVLQDSRRKLHLQGSSAEQIFWRLDGFNITDPITGQLESQISVDGLRAVEFSTNRYSAEIGKGSGGAVDIRTGMGDDQWRPSATNFVPGIEHHKGLVLSNWTPRASLSGPLRRGRAWLYDSMDVQYDKHVVEELPAGEDRSASWRASNLLRSQINLTPSQILTASWLVNYWYAPRTGLSFLDPIETTVDRRSRQHFLSIKDQLYLGSGALLEVGYAATRGFAREIPQGGQLYILAPDGRRGNFFNDALRQSGRDQWLANVFFPTFDGKGAHQLKAGMDLNRVDYYQRSQRHGYEFYRADGTRSRRIDFAGHNELRRKNFEAASYAQDRWKPLPNLLVEMGVRLDWDQILRDPVLSPRISFALGLPGLENTKLAGAFGLYPDGVNLRVLSRHLDQYAVARYFLADGRTLGHGPAASVYFMDERELRMPASRNWSLGLEHLLPWGLHTRLEYLRKRGRDGLTFDNAFHPDAPQAPDLLERYQARVVDGLFVLRNRRQDRYNSLEVTVRKNFRAQSQWMASYTRSSAFSNSVVDVNVDDPHLVSDNEGRVPWDAPNRLLSWGLISLTERNSIAYLAEWRDGFPFHVIDEEGRLVGKVSQLRFPRYFNLNLHWERKFTLGRHRWAWRGGSNNVTDRLNASVVNNNAASQRFLQFSGGQRRAFVMRLRWLGKK